MFRTNNEVKDRILKHKVCDFLSVTKPEHRVLSVYHVITAELAE